MNITNGLSQGNKTVFFAQKRRQEFLDQRQIAIDQIFDPAPDLSLAEPFGQGLDRNDPSAVCRIFGLGRDQLIIGRVDLQPSIVFIRFTT